MKNTLVFSLVTALFFAVNAQDICPEFANMVNALNADGQSAKELGMEKSIAKQQKKGLYRGWDNSIRLEGASAKVSVTSSPIFTFRPMNASVHPSQQIKLYPFNTEKQFRDLDVGGTNMWGGSKNKKAEDDSIDLTFERLSDGCWKVTPSVNLPKGEYAFSLGMNSDVKGASAGMGSSVAGQTWFGFSVK